MPAGVRYKKAVVTHFLSDVSSIALLLNFFLPNCHNFLIWQTQKNDVDLETSSIIPVQTLLTGYGENDDRLLVKQFTQEINYFNIREIMTDDISSEVFDVSNCFPDDKSRTLFDVFLRTEGKIFLIFLLLDSLINYVLQVTERLIIALL